MARERDRLQWVEDYVTKALEQALADVNKRTQRDGVKLYARIHIDFAAVKCSRVPQYTDSEFLKACGIKPYREARKHGRKLCVRSK